MPGLAAVGTLVSVAALATRTAVATLTDLATGTAVAALTAIPALITVAALPAVTGLASVVLLSAKPVLTAVPGPPAKPGLATETRLITKARLAAGNPPPRAASAMRLIEAPWFTRVPRTTRPLGVSKILPATGTPATRRLRGVPGRQLLAERRPRFSRGILVTVVWTLITGVAHPTDRTE